MANVQHRFAEVAVDDRPGVLQVLELSDEDHPGHTPGGTTGPSFFFRFHVYPVEFLERHATREAAEERLNAAVRSYGEWRSTL